VQLDNGLMAYQAIIDQNHAVGLRLFENPQQARLKHIQGIKRLLNLKYPKIIKQAQKVQIGLKAEMAWNALDSGRKLIDELIDSLLEKHIATYDWIATQKQFDQLADQLNKQLYKSTYDWSQKLTPIMDQWYVQWQQVEDKHDLLSEATYTDMQYQLDYMIYADFLHHVRLADLDHYSRYLNGLSMRLETALHSPQKEQDKLTEFNQVSQPFYNHCDQMDEFTEAHQDFLLLLEELRISLFAQSLGTKQKVSVKRLRQAFKEL
ncbi:MAG: DUF3418 domain-containing protein, partial [Marinicella sp.]